nr:hypothetical protein BCS91_12710 [Vibrio cyclitrophicus]PMP29939.1 hypothetical protein BCS90_00565 [Vibrio cyclitrophicus]
MCLILLSANCFAKTKYFRGSTDVTTKIEIYNLYTESITGVSIVPNKINLKLLADKSGFEREDVHLIIETDIPSGIANVPDVSIDVPYSIELVQNDAHCINNNFLNDAVDFSATQSANPIFVSTLINNVGSGSDNYQFVGVGSSNGSVVVDDFAETDSLSNGLLVKKNTHKVELSFLTISDIAQAMPSGSAMNTECAGSLSFSVTIGL